MFPEIPLKRVEDVRRLENYLGRTVKITLNPRWSVDKKTATLYITPMATLQNSSGDTVGIIGDVSGRGIVIKTPNRSAGVRWWQFLGRTTYYVRPAKRSDINAESYSKVIVIQRAEPEPNVQHIVDQMARAYAIQETMLQGLGKSWTELSATNLRRGGIIDAQLFNMPRNRSWLRGAVLSAKERFGVDALAEALGVEAMDIIRGRVPEISKALHEIIEKKAFWKRMVDDLEVSPRMKKAVINTNSTGGRVGALLVAERVSAIKELHRIKGLV